MSSSATNTTTSLKRADGSPAMAARVCPAVLDADASLYVSHGAPRLHGIELDRGRPLFYDLGTFDFQTATEDDSYDAAVSQSVIAECRFAGGRFRKVALTLIRLNEQGVRGPRPRHATARRSRMARRRALILDRLTELSRPFGATIERSGETAIVFGARD